MEHERSEDTQTSGRQRRFFGRPEFKRSGVADVILLSIGLLIVSAPILWLIPDRDIAMRPTDDWFIVALAVMFAFSVVTVFHVEFRHGAFSFSLSEVPLAMTAVFAAPIDGTAARLLGSITALVVLRKLPPYKLFFNVSMFVMELTIIYGVMHVVIGESEPSNGTLIMVATIATLASTIAGSIAVSVAIARFEGGTLRRVVDELKSAWVLVVNAATAGVLLGLALESPVIAILAIIPVVALWVLIRRHGEIAQELRDLDEIHGFAGRIGRSLDLDEICLAAVREASRLLRADVALLRITTANGETRQFASGPLPDHLVLDVHDDWWMRLDAESEARLIEPTEITWAQATAVDDLSELIVSPVADGTGTIGTLLIAGPGSVQRHFDDNNVSHVRNLAEQLATSLRKGLLHRQMEFEARHDTLTELPNRNAFEQHVAAWSLAPQRGRPRYLLMLDLDRFKEVNDTLGHHAGDDLLVEFSRRIAADIGREDIFARLAGDEFAILARCTDDDAAVELAKRCIDNASRPVILDGLSVVVTASVGITALRESDTDAVGPMRRADIAMYNAKSHHLGIEFYREDLDRRTPARLSMLGDLRQAIETNQLNVEYQPKLDLASGLITGAEALVRWTHPVRGVVSPTDFVRVAEETGLIKQLTDLMLARGLAELRNFHARGHHLGLSVNLSTHDLVDVKLPARVQGHLSANGVDPGSLTLEITESSLLIDGPRARATIDELHNIGVRLSIDDFGTGYSSLSYLRQLPVRELKIDQSFVMNVLIDEQDTVIVRSTIDLGHNLGLEVVAEGVESEEVLERLRQFGCDVAQGYCISRPLTAERFLAWLGTTEHRSRKIDPLRPEAWIAEIDELERRERRTDTADDDQR